MTKEEARSLKPGDLIRIGEPDLTGPPYSVATIRQHKGIVVKVISVHEDKHIVIHVAELDDMHLWETEIEALVYTS